MLERRGCRCRASPSCARGDRAPDRRVPGHLQARRGGRVDSASSSGRSCAPRASSAERVERDARAVGRGARPALRRRTRGERRHRRRRGAPDRRDRLRSACRTGCGASSRIARSGRPAATRTSARCRAARRDLPGELATSCARSRSTAWRIVGGVGYGRVDLRIDERGPPVDPRGEREPRHRADGGARAHGARGGHRLRGAGAAASASSRLQRSREVDDDRRAMGARAAALGRRALEIRSRTCFPRARRSVSIAARRPSSPRS